MLFQSMNKCIIHGNLHIYLRGEIFNWTEAINAFVSIFKSKVCCNITEFAVNLLVKESFFFHTCESAN